MYVPVVLFSGKRERVDTGCNCQPLKESDYVSMIISTFGEFAC